jgi:hypothetical protein
MFGLRVAGAAKRLGAVDLGRTVPTRRVRDFPIELGLIDIGTKASLNGFEICPVPVASHLDTICKPL